MRILYAVHQYLPGNRAGTEVYTHTLAKNLAGEAEVLVFCGRGCVDPAENDGGLLSYEGVPVYQLAKGKSSNSANPLIEFRHDYINPAARRSFAKLLDSYQPDIVHVQHLKGLGTGLITEAQVRGIPVVMTLHDYWAICPNAQFVRPDGTICYGTHWNYECAWCAAAKLSRPAVRYLAPFMMPLFAHRRGHLKRALEAVNAFVTPSLFLRNKYAAAGYPVEKIHILENGLDLSRIAGRHGNDAPYRGNYAYVGSLAWQKGVHVLVDAFLELGDCGATLRIYGNPDMFPDYAQELVRAVGACPWIEFMGEIASEHVGEVYEWADYAVLGSLWWENSPVTIQEAYAAGVPVIAPRLGAMEEKVHDGETGLLYAAGDAASLARIIRTTNEDKTLLSQLRPNLEAVSIDEHAMRVMALYQELLGQ